MRRYKYGRFNSRKQGTTVHTIVLSLVGVYPQTPRMPFCGAATLLTGTENMGAISVLNVTQRHGGDWFPGFRSEGGDEFMTHPYFLWHLGLDVRNL